MVRLYKLAIAAAAMALSADAMKFTDMSRVDANGGLHAMIGEDAPQCEAPTKGIGCFSAVSSMQLGIDELTRLGGGNDKTAAILKDVLTPILRFAVTAASSSVMGSMLKTSFCFGEFEGSEVTGARPGSSLGTHSCNNIPLKTGENYLITSLGLPSLPFQAICPGDIGPDDLITFCTAYATCNSLPTLGFMLSGPLLACAIGNNALAGSTAGIAKAFSQAIKFGLAQIGFGFSLGADLEYSVTVWDGNDMTQASVTGNYFDYVELNFDPLSDALMLPADIIAITGHSMRLINIIGDAGETANALASAASEGAGDAADGAGNSIPTSAGDAKDIVLALANSDAPQDAIAAIVKNFAMVMEMYAALTIKLSSITGGALPDTPTLKFATFAVVASTQPKSMTGLPRGFYATIQGMDILKVIMNEFFTYLSENIGGIIDSLLGDGAMDNFLESIAPTGESDTIFAFAANENLVGFFIQAPVGAILLGPFGGDLAGMVSMGCKVRTRDGHFSCEIDYKEPKWLSAFLDGAVFVAKAALKFFDETGSVIAAVAKDLSGAAISWTNDAIKQTAKDIENGVLDAGDELKNWAHDGGGFLNCGSEKAASAALCGTDFIESAADCGSDFFTDVAKCGFKFLGNLCSGCSGCSGCTWGGCSGCSGCSGCFKKQEAASCSVALKCDVPKSCNIPKHC